MRMQDFTSQGSVKRTLTIVMTLLLIAFASLARAQDKDETFIYAAVEGDVKKVEAFLNEGANVNAKGKESNRTALMWASLRGNLDVVRLLLEKGCRRQCTGRQWRDSLAVGFRERRHRGCEVAVGKGRRYQRTGQEWPQRLDDTFVAWSVGCCETTSGERNRCQCLGQNRSDCFDVGFRARPDAHCGAAEKLRSHAVRWIERTPSCFNSWLDCDRSCCRASDHYLYSLYNSKIALSLKEEARNKKIP